MEVVGKISGIRLDLIGDLVFFFRITEINGVDATNFGERHFHPTVDRRLLVIASILAAPGRRRLRPQRVRESTGYIESIRILRRRSARVGMLAPEKVLFTIEPYEFVQGTL